MERKQIHDFLADELFAPLIGSTDLTRLNMFDSHLNQKVVLDNPEFPKVFTGFENQGGKYSDGYKTFPDMEGFKLYKKIYKNDFNIFFIFVNEKKKKVFVYFYQSTTKLTENYGYKNVLRIATLKEGEEIAPSRVLQRSTSYDKNLNYSYGINCKAAFWPFKGQTYEDSIVISTELAKKFVSTHVEEIQISLNTNDILTNLYGGDKNHYKTFPNIGEDVKDKMLCVRRRLSYESMLFDFSADNLREINYETDDVFYTEGKVVDIDVFDNSGLEGTEGRDYNNQVYFYLDKNKEYYRKVHDYLKFFKDKGYDFLGDSNYWLQRSNDIISGKRFRVEASDFDNIMLVIRTVSENPLTRGSKISGRCGNKGVISVIVKDRSELPCLDDGTQADMCLNIFGVIGRVNLSQLIEQETNFIAEQFLKHQLLVETNNKKRAKMYVEFISFINKEQGELTKTILSKMNDEELEAFFEDMKENGIFINIKPFYTDGYNAFKLYELYKKYNVQPRKAFIYLNGKKRYLKCPIIIGDIYYMRLKHDAKCKFSARAGGYLSLSNVPSKNNRQFKESRALYSKTAVRLGEMELNNLMLLKDQNEIIRFISMYSSNEHDRENLSLKLLGVSKDINEENNVFNIEKVEQSHIKNLNMSMLDSFLYALGMKLVDDDVESDDNEDEEVEETTE